jgi:hypothetical protein
MDLDRYGKHLCGRVDCFEVKKIEKHVEEGRASSPVNLNKALYALEYLAQLRSAGLECLFKGGSAVQLLLPHGWQRLSIDLDIEAEMGRKEIEEILEGVHEKFGREYFSFERRKTELAESGIFNSYRIQIPGYPTGEAVILLDAMGITTGYKTRRTKLKSFFYISDIEVETPTVDSMLGDKLSTLGPNTIGRRLKDSRNGLEYIKHLYDIKNLLPQVSSLGEAFEAYRRCHDLQLKIREVQIDISESVKDLVDVCKLLTLTDRTSSECASYLGDRSAQVLEQHGICRRGSERFQPLLTFGNNYTWENIRETASAVSFIARLFEMLRLKEIDDAKATESLKSLQSKIPELARDEEIIDGMLGKISSLPVEKRWHIQPREIKGSPRSLIYWYGHFYPTSLLDLLEAYS